jgi:predicted house-cleaning noncanonical NTP pyrophosphatase (MazG superfamily)
MHPNTYPTPPTPTPPAPTAPAAKLIRDRTPELTAEARPGPLQLAEPAESGRRVRDKLLEEAHEAAATSSPTALVEELGDLLQVMHTPASHASPSPAAIEAARARKAHTRGTYTRRLVWHQPTTDATL